MPSVGAHELWREQRQFDERASFLSKPLPEESACQGEGDGEGNDTVATEHRVPARVVRRLYLSHFLSTWNTRVFEFGAVLYLATIYSGTLLPMSIYAFTRGVAAILFAPAVGQYIDTGNRLQVVRLSIVLQRFVVAASCAIFYILAKGLRIGPGGHGGMLALLAFLACVEKLCSIMNLVSVEKDWVVVVAEKDPEALRVMNAQMRRIDLLCKLLGPLFIALVGGASIEIAIMVNFAMNVGSVLIEYLAIAKVYRDIPALRQPKTKAPAKTSEADPSQEPESRLINIWRHVRTVFRKSANDFDFYLHHRAFLPSIAGALLYLTVLSFAGQMVTYLLLAGYSSTQIGIARTFSVVFEVLATWVAPWLMARIGPARAGLWMSSWQVTTLITGVVVFWVLSRNPIIAASGLVVGTILSRVGLRGFDLCVQVIVQEDVEADNRGAFSSVEAAWQNAFELLSYASTIVFSRPQQFKWPTLISVVAVTSASVVYASFIYLRRGHLVHLDALSKLCSSERGRQREQERGIEMITSSSDV